MTQEEKAKRYDEAIEYAHYLINERCKEGSYGSFHRLDLERMFPELCESEDERIINNIKKVIGWYRGMFTEKSLMPEQYQEIDAWLEKQGEIIKEWSEMKMNNIQTELQEMVDLKHKTKQGEQKPAFEMKTPEESLGIDSDTYNKIVDECVYELEEQKPTEWSEEDEMFVHGLIRGLAAKRDIHGHTTFSSDCIDITKTINWLKSLKDRVQPQQEWSEKDEKMMAAIEHHLNNCGASITSILWLKSLRPQTKQEWSEDVESAIQLLEDMADEQEKDYCPYNANDLRKAAQYLETCRPQDKWKPSKEQIEALDFAADCIVPAEFCIKRKVLKDLLAQLKKLRED